jgi:hypothetical protein
MPRRVVSDKKKVDNFHYQLFGIGLCFFGLDGYFQIYPKDFGFSNNVMVFGFLLLNLKVLILALVFVLWLICF